MLSIYAPRTPRRALGMVLLAATVLLTLPAQADEPPPPLAAVALEDAAPDRLRSLDTPVSEGALPGSEGGRLGPGMELLLMTSGGAAAFGLGAGLVPAALYGGLILYAALPGAAALLGLAAGIAGLTLPVLLPLTASAVVAGLADVSPVRAAIAALCGTVVGGTAPFVGAFVGVVTAASMLSAAGPRPSPLVGAAMTGALLATPITAGVLGTGLGAGVGYTATAMIEGPPAAVDVE